MSDMQTPTDIADRFGVQTMLDRWTESSRQATERFLDVYQKTVGQLADVHVKTARAVDLPAVVTLAETQAAVSRDVADAYVTSVRRLLDR
jgi:hypothetical protein